MFLNLASNRLTRVTPEIGKLTELRRLGLKGNALVFLPPSIGDLSHLVELYLTGNMLEALPPEVWCIVWLFVGREEGVGSSMVKSLASR